LNSAFTAGLKLVQRARYCCRPCRKEYREAISGSVFP